MKKVIITFIVYFLLLISCKDKVSSSGEIIIGEATEINATTLFSDVKIIKLESSNDAIIGAWPIVKFVEDRIYITDDIREVIYIYDVEGRFLNKLMRRGQSGEEYLKIADFFVDTEASCIEVYDGEKNRILFYDLSDFSCLKVTNIPLNQVSSFHKQNGNYYFYTATFTNFINDAGTNSELIYYNTSTGDVFPLFDVYLNSNAVHYFGLKSKDIFKENNKEDLFASLSWHGDKIYNLNDKKMTSISINFGRNAIPLEKHSLPYDDRLSYVQTLSNNSNVKFLPLLYAYDDDYIIVGSQSNFPPTLNYYFKFLKSGKEYHSSKLINDFPGFDNSEIYIDSEQGGNIVSIIDPSNLEENSPVLDHLKVTTSDNPVILIFKLKEQ